MVRVLNVWLALSSVAPLAWGQPAEPPPPVLSDDTPIRLPWAEVASLLAKNRAAGQTPPPQAYVLGAANAEGEASGRDLVLKWTTRLVLLGDAWTPIPLWRSNVTVQRASLDGQPAAFAMDGDQLVLLARGRGPHTLAAELVIPAAGAGNQVSLPFATPVSVAWRVSLPGADARIEPSVRQKATPSGGRVVLEALTPPVAAVQVEWSAEHGTAVAARVTAESLTFLTFQEGTTSGHARFSFELVGGSRDQLAIHLPAALEVLSVQAPDLANWAVETAEAGKRLVAHFRRPQRGRVEIELGFELPKPGELAELPRLSAENVTEQRAYVAASAESPMSMEQAELEGGEPIDARNLPLHLLRDIKAPFALAYRHDGTAFAAKVRIDRHATVGLAQATIDAAYFTTVLTDEGQEVVKATFLVKNNLRPYLGLTLPEGASLWAAFVSGESVDPAAEGRKLLLPLVKSRELGTGDTIAVHTVEAGYTLSDIALQYYHDASKWKLIASENRGVMGNNSNAQVGQALKIPRLAGPAGSDLSTAFPVEIVYSRTASKPGSIGAASFEGPVADLDVMKVVWTVYLPSRLDPLRFSGDLAQSSYVRYGLFRRLSGLLPGPVAAVMPGLGLSAAFAGESGSLRERFSYASKSPDIAGALAMNHPREVLPLIGRGYVFKKFLQEREPPRIQAVYLDRSWEKPVRWLTFVLGLLISLFVARALARGDAGAVQRAGVVSFAFVAGVLLVGHYVLGTHARAVLGLVLGGWLWLLFRIFAAPASGGVAQRALARGVRVVNAAALALILAAGIGPFTVFFALVTGALGVWFIRRKGAKPVAAVAVAALCLGIALPARAQNLPANAEVTLPYGKLKDLLGGKAASSPPPRDHSLLSAEYSARLSGDSFEVEGTVELEVHGEGWVQVPLIPSYEALTSLSLDGKPFAASTAGGTSLAILKGAGRHRLSLSFVAPVHEQGAGIIGLVPGVPSTLRLEFPSPGMEPEVTGAIETGVAGAGVNALVPPQGEVQLRWSTHPRTHEEPARVEAELRMVARTLQIISVDEHRTYALVRYQIQRGATRSFAIQLPDDVELIDVQGDGIDQHEVASVDGKRLLSVTTSSNVRDTLELSFAYDWRASTEGKPIPTFRVRGVRSETGTLGIEASQSKEIQLASVEGAAAIDVRGAPELFQHTDKPIVHAIRYLQQPYTVKLSLLQHPEVALETATVDDARYTTVLAKDGRAISEGRFKLRNARRAFLGVTLPAASEIQSVLIGGTPAKPVRDAKGNLLLPLVRSASSANEMQQFDVELVYLTHLPEADRFSALRSVLPTVDLRVSKVTWELYLPPGTTLTHRPETEAASDSMQWATAPRAILAGGGRAGHPGADALASGGILPVRFNLPTHGEPERFYAHYLPAGVAPAFDVKYADISVQPVWQGLGTLALLAAAAAGVMWTRRWIRHAST
jgi:nucleoid-associated protein YgaU